jgi:hypothetical protein
MSYNKNICKFNNNKKGYPPFRLLSDIGGTLGLFIGISLLSLIEIVEILIELLFISYKYYKQKKQEKKLVNNTIVVRF